MDERAWDQKLHIRTGGWDASHADAYRYPYEPTAYAVLERLAGSGYVTPDSVLVDYGCGKGRVGFFLNHTVGCRTVGVEYDEAIYGLAMENLASYGRPGVEFVCARAETYEIGSADCFYFFNPFSLELLQSVMGRILESYYCKLKRLRLFFYYPSDAYVSWLMTRGELVFLEELDCRDLFPGSQSRERILIFELPELKGELYHGL